MPLRLLLSADHRRRPGLALAVAATLLFSSSTLLSRTAAAAAASHVEPEISSRAAPCQDAEPPRITCPSIVTLFGRRPVLPDVVAYRIPVDDDCPGARIRSQRPKPGTALRPSRRSHNVTLVAVDTANKTGTCQWEVSVPKIVTTRLVRAKVRPGSGAVVWTLPTAVPNRRPRAGYLLGIAVQANRTAVRQRSNGSEMTFYASTRSGRGQRLSDRLRYDPSSAAPRHEDRAQGRDAAKKKKKKRNLRRIFWERPVPFEANETFDVRIAQQQYRVRYAAVAEVRVALLLQYFPRPAPT